MQNVARPYLSITPCCTFVHNSLHSRIEQVTITLRGRHVLSIYQMTHFLHFFRSSYPSDCSKVAVCFFAQHSAINHVKRCDVNVCYFSLLTGYLLPICAPILPPALPQLLLAPSTHVYAPFKIRQCCTSRGAIVCFSMLLSSASGTSTCILSLTTRICIAQTRQDQLYCVDISSRLSKSIDDDYAPCMSPHHPVDSTPTLTGCRLMIAAGNSAMRTRLAAD